MRGLLKCKRSLPAATRQSRAQFPRWEKPRTHGSLGHFGSNVEAKGRSDRWVVAKQFKREILEVPFVLRPFSGRTLPSYNGESGQVGEITYSDTLGEGGREVKWHEPLRRQATPLFTNQPQRNAACSRRTINSERLDRGSAAIRSNRRRAMGLGVRRPCSQCST